MSETSDDWKAAWRPVINQIGADLVDGATFFGIDRAEPGAIRRYLEPLEFECALHTDAETARAYGFADVTAPYTAISTWAAAPVWEPGEQMFTSAERNALPARLSVKPAMPPGGPPVSNYFATDSEVEYLRPVLAGERLGRRGNRLIGCSPKETRVGRGAFLSYEWDVVTEAGEVVARQRATMFWY